jgi:di/tripeptidase
LVLDGEALYEVTWELASTTEVMIALHGARGGHSGVDIDKPDNINAIKVMSELDSLIPQGVVEKNDRGIVTSINAGLTEGGSAGNVIASEAKITYLVRSTNAASEAALLEKIRDAVSRVERKYQALQRSFGIDLKVNQSLPPWPADIRSPLLGLVAKATEQVAQRRISPLSVHAGAETNIYANKENSKGETLRPLLLGVANLDAIHTGRERMDWRSLIAGRDWMLAIIGLLAKEGIPETQPK